MFQGGPLPDSRSQPNNLFHLFLNGEFRHRVLNWEAVIGFHQQVLQQRFGVEQTDDLCSHGPGQEMAFGEKAHERGPVLPDRNFHTLPVTLQGVDENDSHYLLSAVHFQEGVLFVFVPEEDSPPAFKGGVYRRADHDRVAAPRPSLVSLGVLVASLHDSERIRAELLPEDYFELIDAFLKQLATSFDKYGGIQGKHTGDSAVCFFIERPGRNYIMDAVNCSLELRRNIRLFSNEWKIATERFVDLFLNIGLDEGQEYFGVMGSTSSRVFTALGDSTHLAGILALMAGRGSIWATKNFINKLEGRELALINFGIRRSEKNRDVCIRRSFGRIRDILDENDPRLNSVADISTLPVTEIFDQGSAMDET